MVNLEFTYVKRQRTLPVDMLSNNPPMERIAERIDARLREIGQTWAWFGRGLGLENPNQSTKHWRERDSGVPARHYPMAAELLGTTVENLLGEDLPPEWTGGYVSTDDRIAPGLAHAGRLRVAEKVAVVGTSRVSIDGEFGELEPQDRKGYVEAASSDPDAYAVRIKGDSLHPAIRHGEFIVVEPNAKCEPGDYVLLGLFDGRKLLMELALDRGDAMTFSALTGGKRITLERREVQFMHVISSRVSASKWRSE